MGNKNIIPFHYGGGGGVGDIKTYHLNSVFINGPGFFLTREWEHGGPVCP